MPLIHLNGLRYSARYRSSLSDRALEIVNRPGKECGHLCVGMGVHWCMVPGGLSMSLSLVS